MVVGRALLLGALCILVGVGTAVAAPVPISFQVEPGGATLQDRESGEAVASASAGPIGTFLFSAEPTIHHYRIERSNFDDLDVTLSYTPDGRWEYRSPLQQGWLDAQTLFMLSCHIRLAVQPSDTQVYIDSEAPNAVPAGDPAATDLEVGGLWRHVRLLPQSNGLVRIPNGWSPPLLYLVHPRFETRMLQIPTGALDALSDGRYPPTPVALQPRYGPFSYPDVDITLVSALALCGLWGLPRWRQRVQRQADKNALLDDILATRPTAAAPGMTHQTVHTEAGADYLLLNQLGAGAMGVVYEAVPVGPGDRQHVAIKVLSQGAWANAETHERFKREVHICQSLHHPAIVKVLDWGVVDSATPCMIMELVHGQTLQAVLSQSGPIPAEQVVAWLLDILYGLRVAHQAGVIHRDLKPANLMVTPSNRIKIMDFGIARLQGVATLTATAGQLGTPAYMSLEHLQARNVVPASDIYSLGVLAYEMLVGVRPFDEPDMWALLGRLLTTLPPHVSEANPDISTDLDAVVWTMLAPQAADRYADCDAVMAALSACRGPS